MNEIEKKIIVLNEVESTNNYANQLILSKKSKDGTVVMTHFQSKGRGQQGNEWESEHGKNLLASIIFYPKFLKASKQFILSKMISLTIVEFLEKEVNEVWIKWPNDIYVGNQKIAGILMENGIKGDQIYSTIAGIGMNLNQMKFLSDAPNPVSLRQLTGKNYQIEQVALELSVLVTGRLKKMEAGNYQDIDIAYFNQLFQKEEWRMYSRHGKEFEAKIIGIGEFGQLQLENRSGSVEEFVFKEVEFII